MSNPDASISIPRPWLVAAIALAACFVFVAGVLGLAGGWWFWSDGSTPADAPVAVEDATTQPGAATQMYTCSMHPQVRSPNPDDKCPICAMDLIPVPADDDGDDDGDLPRLRLTSRAAALMQVEVRPAERRAVQASVRLFGRLGYDETRLSTITARVPGRVDQLEVQFTGATVRQGEAMLRLYSPMLIAAQEELLQAMTFDHVDSSTAARDRLRLLGIDDEQIADIERAGQVRDHLTIRAPIGGIVLERLVTLGDYVDTGTPLFRLVDLNHLWVLLEVFESDLHWLAVGQAATFNAQSFPGEVFEGRVTFIDPVLDERTRTVRVRVDLPNADGRLKPGMFVRGEVHADVRSTAARSDPDADADIDPEHEAHALDSHHDEGDHAADQSSTSVTASDEREGLPLLIPRSAPLLTGERAVVYVQLPEMERPTYELRHVVLGPRVGDWFVVREGLVEGDLVVTHGNFKIDSELQIRGRPSMMQPEGGAPPTHDHGSHAAHAEALEPATEEEIANYPLDTCVVTGLPLDSMGGPMRFEYEGRTLLFCCDACLGNFLQDPERYLDKLDEGGAR